MHAHASAPHLPTKGIYIHCEYRNKDVRFCQCNVLFFPPLCHITMLVSTVEAQGRLLQAMLVWILF